MTAFVWETGYADYQRGPMDLGAAARDGVSAVTARCTEGHHFFADRHFRTTVATARAAGVPILGACHALHPGTVADQVDWFLELVGRQAPWWDTHPCWFFRIDAEKPAYVSRAPDLTEIKGFADLLCQRTGVATSRILVAAPRWLYGDSLAGLRYRLCAANLGNNPATHYAAGYPGDTSTRWAPYSSQPPLLLRFGAALRVGTQNGCTVSGFRGTPTQLFAALTGAVTGATAGPDSPLQSEIKNLTVAGVKPAGLGGPDNAIRFGDYLGWTATAIGDIAAQVAAVASQPTGSVDQAALTTAIAAALHQTLPAAVHDAVVAAFSDPAVIDVLMRGLDDDPTRRPRPLTDLDPGAA